MCQTIYDTGLLAQVRLCCILKISDITFMKNWFKKTFGLSSSLKDLLNVDSIDLIVINISEKKTVNICFIHLSVVETWVSDRDLSIGDRKKLCCRIF